MTNERLRAAIKASGFTVDRLAAATGNNRKTVERWVHPGRQPHRSTRIKLASLLSVDEVHLWPDLVEDLHTSPNSETELVHVYPTRSAIPLALWNELIADVREQMDVLVFSGQFLVEQHNVIPVIKQKADQGTRFRFVVGDETSTAVIQRAMEEGTTGGLEGRVQMMRRYLTEVSALPGVDVRTHGTILYNSIYRFDDQMLVNGHAFGSLAGQNPILHLRRLDGGLMWEHYMRSFERVYEQASPERG